MTSIFHGWISAAARLLRLTPLLWLLGGLALSASPYVRATDRWAAPQMAALPAAEESEGYDILVSTAAPGISVPDVARHDDIPRNPRYERILSFDALGSINPNGTMAVEETIKVYATGDQIRRGIFRTLPLSWNRQDGKIFRVDYQVEQILRDGHPEAYSEKQQGNTLTIRIGSADRLLDAGEYTYVIRYQVSNHFSRFPEWDELYWNVTGNGWPYDIDHASFRLKLPDAVSYLNENGLDSRLRTIDTYTGYEGDKGTQAEILPDGSVRTLSRLAAEQGLTVVYTWPRDILASAPAPAASSPWAHFFLPTEKTMVLWVPVLLMVLYYLSWWWRNVVKPGLKMPAVIPLYDTPEGMTPGFVRYVSKRSYDDIAFSSDLLDMVARRVLSLSSRKQEKASGGFLASLVQKREAHWLSPATGGRTVRLSDTDRTLLKILFSGKRQKINLGTAHQKPMQNALSTLEKRCTDQRSALFMRRARPLWCGVGLLLLIPILCAIFINVPMGLITVLLSLFVLFGLGIIGGVLHAIFNARGQVMRWGCMPVFLFLIAAPIVGGFSSVLVSLPLSRLPAGYPGALLICFLVLVFYTIKAPRYTQAGLNALATAKGLKRYLSAAEEHRFETLYPPDKRVEHFEKMLPYALALGVGKTWADTFSQYLITSGSMSEVFANGDWGQVRSFSDSCRSSSSAEPSRSSGGSSGSGSGYSGSGSSGGGSSGGGSGGGGGGGW